MNGCRPLVASPSQRRRERWCAAERRGCDHELQRHAVRVDGGCFLKLLPAQSPPALTILEAQQLTQAAGRGEVLRDRSVNRQGRTSLARQGSRRT